MLTLGIYAWGGKDTLALRIGMTIWMQNMFQKIIGSHMRFRTTQFLLSSRAEVVEAEEVKKPNKEDQLLIA